MTNDRIVASVACVIIAAVKTTRSTLTIFVVVFLLLLTAASLREPTITRHRTKPPVDLTDNFRVPVLMYHRINDDAVNSPSPLLQDLTVPTLEFESQMRYLSQNGFEVLSSREVEQAVREHKRLPSKAIVVTMDDGYKDNFEKAFPILKRFDLRATIFLVTSTVGTPNHLSWDDVLLMKKDGLQYGSHTVHHFDLTMLPVTQLDFELRESKKEIEYRTAELVSSIAYPAGKYNEFVKQRAQEAGYLAGWKKGGGPVSPDNDPLLMPRIRVRGQTTLSEFARKVNSGVELIRQERRKV